jgi:hypothetical protein
MDRSSPRWRKSSYSGPEADCVEVGLGVEVVGVRDSKDPGDGVLVLPETAWWRLRDYLGE